MDPSSRHSTHRHANAETGTTTREVLEMCLRNATQVTALVMNNLTPFDRSSDHDDTSNSEPEPISNRSPVARGRDRTPSPPRGQPRGEAHARNRSHTGRQPATDPAAQRKRRLCEDVSLAIKDTNKRKKSEHVSFHDFP